MFSLSAVLFACSGGVLILGQSTESTHNTEAELLPGLLAVDLTVDLEDTADLQNESTADRTMASTEDPSSRTEPLVPQNVETQLRRDSENNGESRASAAGPIATDDLRLAPMPRLRTAGFFAFAACALVAVFFGTQRHPGSSHSKADVTWKATSPPGEVTPLRTGTATMPVSPVKMQKAGETRTAEDSESKGASSEPSVALGEVTFDSLSFVTSEKALAAVFILKRTKDVKGRVLLRWAARSGSADAGIDFSDASGTARFADGQRQLAIYVPLRNDLLKEEDETFKVCLRSPRQVRIHGKPCAEVTIRDDDSAAPT